MPESIDLFLRILSLFPEADLEVEQRDDAVIVRPASGFEVSLYVETEKNSVVACSRWHTHYDEPEQAAYCAYWLLTPYYRIGAEYKGSLFVATWIEQYGADGWTAMEPVFYLNPDYDPDWALAPGEAYKRVYASQASLPPLKPFDEVAPGSQLDERGLPEGWQAHEEIESSQPFARKVGGEF